VRSGYLNVECRLLFPNQARSPASCLVITLDRTVVITGTLGLPIASRPHRIARQILEPVVLIGARVAREDGERLEPQELRPSRSDPSRRRTEAAPAEHGGDGGGRDADPELQQLAPDPHIAPPRVLPRHPQDQLADPGLDERTTGPAATPPAPTSQESPVPPGERVGTHDEAGPSLTWEETARRRQKRTVGVGVARSRAASTGKNLELVAQDGDLEVPLIGAANAGEQANHPTQEPVQDGREHRRSVSPASPALPTPLVSDRIDFLYPTGSA